MTETLTAQNLLDNFELYPELVELYVGNGEWREITHISDWKNVNGVLDTDEHIHIECDEYQYRYQRMDNVTIRYEGDEAHFDSDDWAELNLYAGECPDCGAEMSQSSFVRRFCHECGYSDINTGDDDDTQPIAVMSDDSDLESQYEDRYISDLDGD